MEVLVPCRFSTPPASQSVCVATVTPRDQRCINVWMFCDCSSRYVVQSNEWCRLPPLPLLLFVVVNIRCVCVCVFLFFASKMFGLCVLICYAPLFYKLRASLCISDSGVHFKTLHQLRVLQYSFTVEISSQSNVSSTVLKEKEPSRLASMVWQNTVDGKRELGQKCNEVDLHLQCIFFLKV